ncbi:MAG: hypothetical protein H5T70_03905, partial [Chloroflexi bacterium]|nr:hypothetical protein [Chloroflexota bacterium]
PDVDPTSLSLVLSRGRWEVLPGRYDLAPGPPLATEAQEGGMVPGAGRIGRDETIYRSTARWPSEAVRLEGIRAYRQWLYAEILYFPLSYFPLQGRVERLRGGEITLSFRRLGGVPSPMLRGEERFWPIFAKVLQNPHDRARFYPLPTAPAEGIATQDATPSYVIITTEAIASGSSQLANFVAAKQAQGFTVKVVTQGNSADDTHYYKGISATSRADAIRNWLKARYVSEHIAYVLLIGNPHPTNFSNQYSVPMRMTYPRWGASDGYVDAPTDFYYADLTSNWDFDGDGRLGEYIQDRVDQTGGIDRTAEVYVGRIPFYESLADLDAILAKIIAYQGAAGNLTWREKMLIAAAISNHGPQDENGDGVPDLPEAYRTFGDDWGEYLKTLAVGNGFSPYTLYEKEGVYSDGSAYPLTPANAPLNESNFLGAWANGYGFVAWWGHGSYLGAYRRIWANDDAPPNPGDHITQYDAETTDAAFITSYSLSSLDNSRPSYVAQVSCLNAQPESSVNLSYSLLKQGAIGTFGATRV